MLVALVLLASMTAAMPVAVKDVQLQRGDVAIEWHSCRGLAVDWRGVRAFEPYGSYFAMHDPGWKKSFYMSSRGHETATVEEKARVAVVTISDESDAFAYRKTVTVEAQGKVVEELEYTNKSQDEASLQVGWKPAVGWLDGARYRVVVGGKTLKGTMTRG
ncbi:MAG: hypothetical protein J7M26_10130, partial [Armatimonadetes bacterium]|nr:hypothetical protein [Armatimonadota bacterium]